MRRVVLGFLLLAGCAGEIDNPQPYYAARPSYGSDGGTALAPEEIMDCDIVVDVFEPSCNSCHNASVPSGGLDLESPGLGKRLLGDVRSNACGTEGARVVAGRPEESLLYQKVAGNAGCGGRMPLLGTPLNSEELSCVRSYIMMLEIDPTFPGEEPGEVAP